MGMAGELVVAAIGAYFVSDAYGYDYWLTLVAIVGLYLVVTQGKGFGGGGAGVFNGIGNVFGGFGRFALSVVVFAMVMMVVTYVMGVSNAYATDAFGKLGWRFWLWPSGYALDLIMWTSAAFLAAGVASHTAKGNAKVATVIFAVALVAIFITKSLPNMRAAVGPTSLPAADNALVNDGVIPMIGGGTWTLAFGRTVAIVPRTYRVVRKSLFGEPTPATPAAPHATPPVVVLEFPISGEGHATKVTGLKAYLDPRRTHTRPSGPAKYVFAEDTSLYFDDVEGATIDRTTNRKVWQDMPEGKYIVYPLVRDDIFFRWWQN